MMTKKLKDPNFQQNTKFCFVIQLIVSAQPQFLNVMLQKKTVDCVIPFFQKVGVPTLPKQKMAEAVEKLLAEFKLRIF